MLGEFDRECRNHGNTYCITKNYIRGLRHKGYMMCDYDADIAMQREECEKFRKLSMKRIYQLSFLRPL